MLVSHPTLNIPDLTCWWAFKVCPTHVVVLWPVRLQLFLPDFHRDYTYPDFLNCKRHPMWDLTAECGRQEKSGNSKRLPNALTTSHASKPNWNESEASGSVRPCCVELHGSFGSEHTYAFHTAHAMVPSSPEVPGFCPGSQMAYYVCLPQSGHSICGLLCVLLLFL